VHSKCNTKCEINRNAKAKSTNLQVNQQINQQVNKSASQSATQQVNPASLQSQLQVNLQVKLRKSQQKLQNHWQSQQSTSQTCKLQNHSTQDSRVVPHRGTNWAALWLTAQIGRDAVLSKSYGRGCKSVFKVCAHHGFSQQPMQHSCSAEGKGI
jgi:hypothetical protein